MELEVCGMEDMDDKDMAKTSPYLHAVAPQVFMMMTEEISLVY